MARAGRKFIAHFYMSFSTTSFRNPNSILQSSSFSQLSRTGHYAQNPRLTRDRHKPFSARWALHTLKVKASHLGGRNGHPACLADAHRRNAGNRSSAGARASNGHEAIVEFRTHRPDITLMDLQMPKMDGVDAMIAIRSEFPEARIIVLTTFASEVEIQRALEAGACAWQLSQT
jgi:hypothetical protein